MGSDLAIGQTAVPGTEHSKQQFQGQNTQLLKSAIVLVNSMYGKDSENVKNRDSEYFFRKYEKKADVPI